MSSIILNGKVRYENLENEFNDAEFLIDGDSLLLSAVNDENFNMIYGGQSLQLVYMIERKLKVFVQKGAKFSIIFLKLSNQILWKRCVALQLFREVLLYHLSSNLGYNVLRDFEDLLDMNYIHYLSDTKPSMIILSYKGIKVFRSTLFDLNEKEMQRIEKFFKAQINLYLKLGMHVSLIESVHLTKTGLFGNLIVAFQQTQLKTEDKPESNTPKLKKHSSNKGAVKYTPTVYFTGYPDIYTQSVAIQLKAGIEIYQCLQRQYPKISKDLVKIYFVYIAIKEKIPLRHRSYGASSKVSLPENIFTIFQKSLLKIWCEVGQKNDFNLVDIWSGNLYVKVLETFVECCDSGKNIDENSDTIIFYQNLFDSFATATGVEIEPFPVLDVNVKVLKFYKRSNGNDKIFEASSESMQILKINSELQTIYAGELYNELDVVGVEEDCDFDIEPEFLDEYQWHAKKSLIDYDVLKSILIQRKKESENDTYKKKVQRGKARLAVAKHRYSEFISGSNNKILIPSVKSKEGKKKLCKKKADVSKKAEKIIEKNKERQRQEKDTKTKREVNDLITCSKTIGKQKPSKKRLRIS